MSLVGTSGAKTNHFCAEESNDADKRRPFYVSVHVYVFIKADMPA